MLREAGLRLRMPERTFATVDHIVPTASQSRPFRDSVAEEMTVHLVRNCRDFGVPLFDLDSGRQGIVHVIGPELGLTQPGMTIACGDSHTSTHGAVGALAFGIGTSQVRDVLATQCLAMAKPKLRQVRVDGKLGRGVYAKDVILTIIRRLGVDIREALTSGNVAAVKIAESAFPVTAGTVPAIGFGAVTGALRGAGAGEVVGVGWGNGKARIDAVLQALERNGLARILAEPNLTSVSGETAKFLAGGEYPVPVGGSERDGPSVIFKPFGVGLSFTPVVLSAGRISLQIETEVSELSNEGAVTVNDISVPALRVRRASSTLELPSGGSLVMAGLISSQTRRNVDGLPGLRNLPVLGALFRSEEFVRSETELVVIVTPVLVGAAAETKLSVPGEDGERGAAALAARSLMEPGGEGRGGYGYIVE
jgi:pilus assembly protein CpaC